jgi:hypothetical protein
MLGIRVLETVQEIRWLVNQTIYRVIMVWLLNSLPAVDLPSSKSFRDGKLPVSRSTGTPTPQGLQL